MIEAIGTAGCIGHEVLSLGGDLLTFVPVPGLDVAAKLLLSIWDAIEMVEVGTAFTALPMLTTGLPRRIVEHLSA